ncbi:hypothetical protein [Manganibacter manganicus]|uniref:Uncharacterized protein n=1 Tax=Manganibacter manganicus TaxID=1873176 RepID=A0A1V8RT80_9HYPH|nr:hypothetical protein [Pseudaminobacter manganicus]OQM76400.1 hypothetical protein BFN67_14865 [Pseudaminobacter manganicus]
MNSFDITPFSRLGGSASAKLPIAGSQPRVQLLIKGSHARPCSLFVVQMNAKDKRVNATVIEAKQIETSMASKLTAAH